MLRLLKKILNLSRIPRFIALRLGFLLSSENKLEALNYLLPELSKVVTSSFKRMLIKKKKRLVTKFSDPIIIGSCYVSIFLKTMIFQSK